MSTQPKKVQTEAEKLKSLLVIVVGFLVLHFLFKKDFLLYISLGVGLLSLIAPSFGNGVLWVWEKIALVLGWINTRILLSVVFYVFLFPIASLYRLMTKNPLQLKNSDSTVFTTRNHKYVKEDIENIW
jgi:hypothetical protein